jgi:hypothetical protein
MAGECNKGQIDGIQHQFNAHEDDNCVFTGQYADRTYGEKYSADDKVAV